jgi:hypothetical protein
MAKKSRPTFQKLKKEKARQQKQQAKAARRLEAKQRRTDATSGMGDTTLDMAGIRPSPQPVPAPRDDTHDQA